MRKRARNHKLQGSYRKQFILEINETRPDPNWALWLYQDWHFYKDTHEYEPQGKSEAKKLANRDY